MREFAGRTAVITGSGSGMGRELARQLAKEGAHLALADIFPEGLEEVVDLCRREAARDARLSAHQCDVADMREVQELQRAVADRHGAELHLLFNNAGIGGGGSVVDADWEQWDRAFAVCWTGVYNCTRSFLPMLVAAPEACLVNISSVNGFWASIGPDMPHSAYSAAKFAVKGFSEALITDLRLHAPHVRVVLVMPGHVGTSIISNSNRVLGLSEAGEPPSNEVARTRALFVRRGTSSDAASDDEIRRLMRQQAEDFRDNAPTSAATAARDILAGIRAGRWRILIGADAEILDAMVRADPANAYEPAFYAQIYSAGHLHSLGLPPDT